ncbi:hypothetical protein [Cytobacillus oceanisediminis]|uniref:hypothetical protein n=1 Tax=Cytobacillus oceanisediminis TaxID=665099 RepID=UPI0037351E3A
MQKFIVTYYLSDNIIAKELKEFESEKEATQKFGNAGEYSCTDDKGIHYRFNLRDVKLISAKQYKGNKAEPKPSFL